ncbi:MAG TPA: hypothetical protein DC058_18290 [Planctomycetaceae bacterium]|nr:hypothetical protein [Planctomycetaceae bacterium]HBC63152.1 hypothetical protein [Planctomycetaceae bacterium]
MAMLTFPGADRHVTEYNDYSANNPMHHGRHSRVAAVIVRIVCAVGPDCRSFTVHSELLDLQVFDRFGLQPRRSTPVPGGLSEAYVWHVADVSGRDFALKAWRPVSSAQLQHRRTVRRWMRDASGCGLNFVPRPLQAGGSDLSGESLILQPGHYAWQSETWCAGASLTGQPAPIQRAAAATALQQLHATGREFALRHSSSALKLNQSPSPAILRRAVLVDELLQGDLQRLLVLARSLGEAGTSAICFLQLLQKWLPWLQQGLQPWRSRSLNLQPVLRDVRTENLLFHQGQISGIIDWDAADVDHPCLDAARLLRSWYWDDNQALTDAAEHWAAQWQLSSDSRQLLSVFDAAAVLLNPVIWLRRLADDPAVFSRLPGARDRFEHLVKSAELWQSVFPRR